MNILDTPGEYKKIDLTQIIQNINELPDQIGVVWEEMKNFILPSHYIQCNKIVLIGMGGSSMGAALAKTLVAQSAKIPLEIVRDYELPGYIDSKTLAIAISYSGETEETLSCALKAQKKDAKIITISSGGALESFAKKHRLPHYKINYGSQPRAALGYSYTAVCAILKKIRLLEINDDQIQKAVTQMKNAMKKIAPEVPTVQNQAKQLAERLYGKIPVIIGSGIMQEVARRYKGQFNENAKTASYFEAIPEMNHNSLVGTEFPESINSKIFVILLGSKFDNQRNNLRIDITAQILTKRRIQYEIIQPTPASNKIAEQLLSIHFGDYTSYYLAMLNGVDPEPVEIIKFLKDSLVKEK
ncbi:bifunctional phosphoglucose/phosphomannose isomerase [Candidatus Berkelbacteria bacterium CG_4_9_14_3_um_filter_39_23]|uniref:Glutamine--fructose-6-phosphate aminotransferase [isomerizing] n=2 Tax=Candidatus Berkelbacteria TaxID=1618330 RepID=A0A2M7CHD8_9BACT|nr:bifunctional phosphoglucose/phosphomannose isomerase [Candidatus Berkelbacteria bacterium]OIP05737.1 MAG: bifunctional phosphoglucose/phosphomannose isomerase [Candidatus Berkelbacteria bacterium CG2_30_39_44]PIR28138.1 MAG: bifunctional phosphoglucose/phosphomannose isomerase [Candidatus Berkelbacteria bacterium CG11_big_fil_rev_8_21_14_0_20_40_23]PIV25049.1 MAG: bifunctional phosphoglucose/phosphomannose isomerase [Candidatus Berkelbacteria bacterium CG03_land_8_20_14_0_80_40_36]PIX30621.1